MLARYGRLILSTPIKTNVRLMVKHIRIVARAACKDVRSSEGKMDILTSFIYQLSMLGLLDLC